MSPSSAASPVSRIATISGLAVALGWPLVVAAFVKSASFANMPQDLAIIGIEWALVAVLAGIVIGWERLPFLSSVGFVRPRALDWLIVGLLAVIAAVVCGLLAARHPEIPTQHTMLAQIVGLPFWLRLALVLTAGICEEVFFRGYAIERLNTLTGNVWSGALLGAVLFILGHVPRTGFGPELAGVAVSGVILAMLYAWRRNLVPCIALHWLIDGYALLIVPAFAVLK